MYNQHERTHKEIAATKQRYTPNASRHMRSVPASPTTTSPDGQKRVRRELLIFHLFYKVLATPELTGAQRRRAPNAVHTEVWETRGRQTMEIIGYFAICINTMNALKTLEIIALEKRQEPNTTRHVRIVTFH